MTLPHPLRLLIHVPLREKRDYRRTLVGLKHALCVIQSGSTFAYDLLPTFKPRKGQEHRCLEHLAEQLDAGWTLALWDVDRFLGELHQMVDGVGLRRTKILPQVNAAWKRISGSADSQILDLRSFTKFPNGHYVEVVAAREEIDFDDYPPRRRRRLRAYIPKSRPVSEDLWGVLHSLILSKSEAAQAWGAYGRWVRANRPPRPRPDIVVSESAN